MTRDHRHRHTLGEDLRTPTAPETPPPWTATALFQSILGNASRQGAAPYPAWVDDSVQQERVNGNDVRVDGQRLS